MTHRELIAKYSEREKDYRRLDALVSGAGLCAELLRDLDILWRDEDGETLTLAEAADRSGYSVAHLGRLIRSGAVRNVGRKGSPRVLAGELPRRPSALRVSPLFEQNTAVTPGQIARAVVTSPGGKR